MNLIDKDFIKKLGGKCIAERDEKTKELLPIIGIDCLPTVDIELVRQGRWIRDEFGTRCGACGLYAYRDKFDQPWESPYCPNCGAKMDGEQGKQNANHD